MQVITHSHNGGGGTAPSKSLVESVLSTIQAINLALEAKSAPKFRRELLHRLRAEGWSDQVPIKAKHKITITGVKGHTGLCLQTGNVSRLYADLLKLQAAFLSGNIEQAIIVVPTRATARAMGRNLASYERLVGELAVFRAIITMPIVVMGFSQ